MPQSDLALAPLQEWMQAVVTHPSDVYEAAEAAEIAVDDGTSERVDVVEHAEDLGLEFGW